MKLKKMLKLLTLASACLVITPLASCGFIATGDEGTMIKEIVTSALENGDTEITIVFMDEEREPVVFVIPHGEDGIQGENGNGIQSITQTLSSDGKTLILTITFTDGSDPKIIEVPVINGKDGVSIKSVTSSTNANGETLITISFEGGLDDVSFVIPKGEKGDAGNGIANVEITYNDDGSQTITITYTDDAFEATTITIPKGDTGTGISYIENRETEDQYILIFHYTDGSEQELSFSKPTTPSTWLSGMSAPTSSMGRDGDFYLNKSDMTIYQKINGSWMLIAQLSQAQEKHIVTFDANGGEFSSDTYSTVFEVTHGETFYSNSSKYIFPTVTREGYKFIGWYTSVNQNNQTAGKFTDLTPVYSDMTLYAWWEA